MSSTNDLVSSLLAESSTTIHLDGQETTAQQLAREGFGVAGGFEARGLEVGDRIAIWAANGLPYLRALAGASAGRFVLVSVNTRFGPDEAWSIIGRSGARALITDRQLDRTLPGLQVIPTDELAQLARHAPTVGVADPDDPYVVFTTSGTTSRPKLVLQTQRSVTRHARDVSIHFGYDDRARLLVPLPLCGAFGLAGLLGGLPGGSDVWLPTHFHTDGAAELIERVPITAMNGSDDMFHRLLLTGRRLSSIKVAGYARFNSSLTDIVARAETAGVTLTGLYGMSEVQALYAFKHPADPVDVRQPGGGWVVSEQAGARVVDPDTGIPADDGVDGELQLFGPSLFSGYLAEGGATIDPELTDSAHVTDDAGQRWFKTGDLARVEADGSFTYESRIGDVLRLGGFLVSPTEIEDVLIEFPGIAEAQVVTVARPEGVRPVAVVVADGGVDEQAVIDHCMTRLAKFKVPIRVLEIEAFPTTESANGTKIQRNKLQQMAAETLAAGA